MTGRAIHILSCIAAMAIAPVASAQRVELYDNALVRDSVLADFARERAAGLWSEALASGELHGSATLDLVIADKGRVQSAFVKESDLPIAWKNTVKNHWYDRRYGFRLPKGHTEKITIELHFP